MPLRVGHPGSVQAWDPTERRPGCELALLAVPRGDRLARVCSSSAAPLSAHARETPARQLQNVSVAQGRGLAQGVAARPHGLPIVDAGMRELWATGWMHNRVRMIVASFLVKDLLISWQEGRALVLEYARGRRPRPEHARLAMERRVRRGCRTVFPRVHPVSQGEKFDPQGDYVRRWCPELAKLPPSDSPAAPGAAGSSARCRRGAGPHLCAPIVSHAIARKWRWRRCAHQVGRVHRSCFRPSVQP